jgi:hypothetical protein
MTIRRADITYHEAERMARRLQEAGWVWLGGKSGRWYSRVTQTYSPSVAVAWKEATWFVYYTRLEGELR